MEFLQENHYDGILCDHSAMAQYGVKASSVSGAPVIVRMHNIEHIIWERFADRFGSFDPRKFYVLSEARKLKRKEIEYSIKVSYSAMITHRDVQVLHDLEDNIRAIHVPVGIDTELFHPNENDIPRIPNRLIHATTYDWVHNVDAIDWFIREVMPTIQRKLAAELYLLGKHMPVRYQTMTDQGIHGLGFVEDINSMLNTASIYIAPLFVGAGIRIKILEAMSAGLPVIASKISAEGIEANREEGLIICNDANDFIAEISHLLMHPEEARVLGENARSFILNHHTWEHSAKLLKTLFLNK
ncbi:MAG: glycosyltransferase [Candidatus Kapaibacteriota bacterium]